jgi:hypothetical protein
MRECHGMMPIDRSNSSPALDAPGIRRSLGMYKRNSVALLIAGVALLAATVGGITRGYARQEALEGSGERVSGIVLDFSWGSRAIPGSITVEFDHGGEHRTARIWLNDNSPRYAVGSWVDIVVDSHDPERVSVVGETNRSPLEVWLLVIGLIGGSIVAGSAIGALARLNRQRQLLTANAWTNAPARAVLLKTRGWSQPCLLEVQALRGPAILGVAERTRTRLKRSQLLGAATIDYVGTVDKYIVLRSSGSTVLLSARKAYTRRSQRNWEDAFARAIRSE